MLGANDLLAFVLELLSLFLWGRWAYELSQKNWVVAILAVVLVTLLWALFFSPKANYPLKGTLRWALEGLILALPLLQFYSKNKLLMVVLLLLITLNLAIQALFGRAQW